LLNNHNAIIYQLLKAFEVLKAKLVSLTTIVEYDIILLTSQPKTLSFIAPPPLLFPFFIPQPTQKVKWFRPFANDTQSQKALKRTNYPLSKLKLVGIIFIPTYKSRDNIASRQALACLGKV